MLDFNITDIFDNLEFQKLQDDLAISTGLAIIVVNYSGEPVTAHSECTKFCSMVRSNNSYFELCTRCDSRGGLEAARIKKPYLYKCHSGIIDFAIPIVYNGYYLGALMAGQVLLEDGGAEHSQYHLEQIYKDDSIVPVRNQKYYEAYQELPKMSLEKLVAASHMLYTICNIYMESKVDPLKGLINNKLQFKQGSETNTEKNKNNILKPVYDYIEKNIFSNLSLNKVAAECGISPNYLSRVFSSENNASFINFINKKKVEYSKQMLLSGNMTICNIASSLGFSDTSYFIRVFKKYEKISPAKYRTQRMKEKPPQGIDFTEDR